MTAFLLSSNVYLSNCLQKLTGASLHCAEKDFEGEEFYAYLKRQRQKNTTKSAV
jgi:hypothetical protein